MDSIVITVSILLLAFMGLGIIIMPTQIGTNRKYTFANWFWNELVVDAAILIVIGRFFGWW